MEDRDSFIFLWVQAQGLMTRYPDKKATEIFDLLGKDAVRVGKSWKVVDKPREETS